MRSNWLTSELAREWFKCASQIARGMAARVMAGVKCMVMRMLVNALWSLVTAHDASPACMGNNIDLQVDKSSEYFQCPEEDSSFSVCAISSFTWRGDKLGIISTHCNNTPLPFGLAISPIVASAT